MDIIDKKYLKSIYPLLIKKWKKIDAGDFWQIQHERLWNAVEAINFVRNTSNYNLLDIGCECCVHSVVASQKFNKVIGIDKKEINYKRGLETINFFSEQGKNISNVEIKYMKFTDYVLNEFEKDNINAILACEVLGMFKDKEVELFIDNLKYIKFIMIQAKSLRKRKNLSSSINSFHLYSVESIYKLLSDNGFNKIILYPENSKRCMVIGEKTL